METQRIDPTQINGWGIDADPQNDPTYPMRDRMNVGQDPDSKHRPDALQPVTTEVLRSIKSLETINGKRAAQFWKDVGSKK